MKRSGKKVLFFSGVTLGLAGLGFSLLAARYEPTVRENTFVGDVSVGGLSPEEAKKKILTWWETEKQRKLSFRSSLLGKLPPPTTPQKLGITVDEASSLEQLPIDSFGDYLGSKLSSDLP